MSIEQYKDANRAELLEILQIQLEETQRLTAELEKEKIRKKESYRTEERLEEENRELRRKVFRQFGEEEYWIFSDDGEDYVESLVCPSVMSAAKLRELVKARAERDELLKNQAKHDLEMQAKGLGDWAKSAAEAKGLTTLELIEDAWNDYHELTKQAEG